MKLEEQVSSLELSKKLKSLGVRQESEFYWSQYSDEKNSPFDVFRTQPDGSGMAAERFAAFTVAELFKEHFDCFGVCDVPSKIEPDKLANHLAEKLCQKLAK